MLGLEAQLITLGANAILAANGGAGGGGCDNAQANAGEDGQLSDAKANKGTKDGGGAGDGGDGGYVGTPAGAEAQAADRGAGGGGGGVGYIIINHTGPGTPEIDGSAIFSPDYVTPPE